MRLSPLFRSGTITVARANHIKVSFLDITLFSHNSFYLLHCYKLQLAVPTSMLYVEPIFIFIFIFIMKLSLSDFVYHTTQIFYNINKFLFAQKTHPSVYIYACGWKWHSVRFRFPLLSNARVWLPTDLVELNSPCHSYMILLGSTGYHMKTQLPYRTRAYSNQSGIHFCPLPKLLQNYLESKYYFRS